MGQRIAERAAVGIRHVVLELGGKSANVLLPDADLDMACGLGVAMCMNNGGQGCALATRMIVHDDIYDEVVERLEAIVGNLPWGDPNDPGNLVGPIIRAEQVDRIDGLVNRAQEPRAPPAGAAGSGATATARVSGICQRCSSMWTRILRSPKRGVRSGLTVIRYNGNDDEAVRVANNSRYGLSAYVQSRTKNAPGPSPTG